MPVDYFLPDAGKVIWQMETIKTFWAILIEILFNKNITNPFATNI